MVRDAWPTLGDVTTSDPPGPGLRRSRGETLDAVVADGSMRIAPRARVVDANVANASARMDAVAHASNRILRWGGPVHTHATEYAI